MFRYFGQNMITSTRSDWLQSSLIYLPLGEKIYIIQGQDHGRSHMQQSSWIIGQGHVVRVDMIPSTDIQMDSRIDEQRKWNQYTPLSTLLKQGCNRWKELHVFQYIWFRNLFHSDNFSHLCLTSVFSNIYHIGKIRLFNILYMSGTE